MLKRQGKRAAVGLAALIFVLGALVLAHIIRLADPETIRLGHLRLAHHARRRPRDRSDLWPIGG
jgi:hypothetical protein